MYILQSLQGLLKSKTFYCNIIGAILQVINKDIATVVDPSTAITIQALLNVIIRFFTYKPLDLK